jgi:hypothetical protein
MKEQVYQQMIIQALPQDALAEIADFVYFIRKKHPQSFQNEIRDSLLRKELHSLSRGSPFRTRICRL